MSRVLLEVCCGSADDVIQAHKAGADRVELNSDLFHGGLTPTLGELVVAKRETGMKIMTMVRPREGGFCYTDAEFATAVEDGKLLLSHGADGLVFGFLHQDGTLDRERTAILEARRHYCWYLKGVPYANYYKEQIVRMNTLEDVYQVTKGIKRDLCGKDQREEGL